LYILKPYAIIDNVKRILIIGHPGAGKSTFAAELGKVVKLPLIHLDKEFWQPGWIETPKNEWRQLIEAIVQSDEWIIDGTYDRTLDIRLLRADTVIIFDYSRYLCLWRICKRIIASYGKVRPDMADDCPERIDLGFLKWAWNYRRDHNPIIYKCLQDYFNNGNVIVFKKPANSIQFLNEVRFKNKM